MAQSTWNTSDVELFRPMKALAEALKPMTDDGAVTMGKDPSGEMALSFVRRGQKETVTILLAEQLVIVGNNIIIGVIATSAPKIIEILDRAE